MLLIEAGVGMDRADHGIATGLAAMTRLLFVPVLFSALLVGSNGLKAASAAALAPVTARLVAAALERRTGVGCGLLAPVRSGS